MSGITWWGIRDPWNSTLAIDEFGAGTLTGNPADGSAYDACGPASIENAAANFEKRTPNYSNIGAIRKDMIGNGEWTPGATILNPRTAGCFLSNVAWEIPRRGYVVQAMHDYQDAVLTDADMRAALAHRNTALIFIVTNASALVDNESNVHGHFIVVATYAGDNADGTDGKMLVLNSDVAGQHGVASGQWTSMTTMLAAEPHGWIAMSPQPTVPPTPPPDIAGATTDIQAAQASLAAALVKLHPTA